MLLFVVLVTVVAVVFFDLRQGHGCCLGCLGRSGGKSEADRCEKQNRKEFIHIVKPNAIRNFFFVQHFFVIQIKGYVGNSGK